jgi:hypothetical protein
VNYCLLFPADQQNRAVKVSDTQLVGIAVWTLLRNFHGVHVDGARDFKDALKDCNA